MLDPGYDLELDMLEAAPPGKNDFVATTAITKLSKLSKRIRGVPGGTSAGKTYGIIPLLVDHAIKENLCEISIVAESVPHLRKGAVKDFIKIMKSTGRWNEKAWNRTHLKDVFSNGADIEFFSVDQPDRLRGASRFVSCIWCNSCGKRWW